MSSSQSAILSELLVLQAQAGSKGALAQLVELWTPRLRARAYRLTRDHEGTNEVLQETWVGIARGLPALRNPARFGPWSHKIVHAKASDWISARISNRTTKSIIHEPDAPNPAGIQEDLAQTIRNEVSTLDPKLREVVYLFYMDQCTIEQIGQVLDIPLGTVKTRLAKARRLLKSKLETKS